MAVYLLWLSIFILHTLRYATASTANMAVSGEKPPPYLAAGICVCSGFTRPTAHLAKKRQRGGGAATRRTYSTAAVPYAASSGSFVRGTWQPYTVRVACVAGGGSFVGALYAMLCSISRFAFF